jgi:hypothetical protein
MLLARSEAALLAGGEDLLAQMSSPAAFGDIFAPVLMWQLDN